MSRSTRTADLLALGRVSNLPTVWTNVLAGVVLAGGSVGDARVPWLMLALSAFYVAGMFLNDAFDAGFDARYRPDRPIPAGRIRRSQVYAAGFTLLAAGVLLLGWTGFAFEPQTGARPLWSGLALAAAIVFYDWRHKGNPLSPVVMGLCRFLSYVAAGWAVVRQPATTLYLGATLSWCYLVGLTYAAKQEHLGVVRNAWPLAVLGAPAAYALSTAARGPASALAALAFVAWLSFALRLLWRRQAGDVPRSVSAMLAGICLWDAVLIAATGPVFAVALAIGSFVLALLLQRRIAAT